MNTTKVKIIIKSFNSQRIIIGINAYDSGFNELYGYWNEVGIATDDTSMQLHKLTLRKNSQFKNKPVNPNTEIFTR